MPKPVATDQVEDVEHHDPLLLVVGHRVQVGGEGGADALGLLVVQPPHPGAVGEPAVVVGHHRALLEQRDPGAQPGLVQRVQDPAGGAGQGQGPLGVVLGGDVVAHPVQVAVDVGLDQVVDALVGQGLLPAQQAERGTEPEQVPGPVPDVRLVEVVDVEDQPAAGVEVGAEVLRVQVALDPDPAGALGVEPGAVHVGERARAGDVGVEQAGRAAVEGERVLGHAPELGAEGGRVGGHQVGERVGQGLDDSIRTLGHLPLLSLRTPSAHLRTHIAPAARARTRRSGRSPPARPPA